MRIALTHAISPAIARCELTHLQRRPIDFERCVEQHRAYCDALARAGLKVVELNANAALPDSTFVEDTAVVVDELAVMSSMGAESRRGELPAIRAELEKYRKVEAIELPARLDGGDVLQVGRKIYVGLSRRTDRAGTETLASLLGPHGYRVIPVPVQGALHLKSACSLAAEQTLLSNPEWIDSQYFQGLDLVSVPPGEPGAANVLWLGERVLVQVGCPRTAELLATRGLTVESVDISELVKAEAGLTCSSIIFEVK